MQNLEEMIVSLAQLHKKTISSAESVTGGRIATALTSVEGASSIFLGGVVAYSSNAKIHALGVHRDEIEKTEGYSSETAKQMAEHVRMRHNADIGIATTGCAGPVAQKNCEVGKIFFGLSVKNLETEVFEMHFSGSRHEIQTAATEFALKKILHILSFAA